MTQGPHAATHHPHTARRHAPSPSLLLARPVNPYSAPPQAPHTPAASLPPPSTARPPPRAPRTRSPAFLRQPHAPCTRFHAPSLPHAPPPQPPQPCPLPTPRPTARAAAPPLRTPALHCSPPAPLLPRSPPAASRVAPPCVCGLCVVCVCCVYVSLARRAPFPLRPLPARVRGATDCRGAQRGGLLGALGDWQCGAE